MYSINSGADASRVRFNDTIHDLAPTAPQWIEVDSEIQRSTYWTRKCGEAYKTLSQNRRPTHRNCASWPRPTRRERPSVNDETRTTVSPQ